MVKSMQRLKSAINDEIIEKAPEMHWEAKNWVVLKSLPGGDEQAPHRDFPSFEPGRAETIHGSLQGGIIVGLMEDTKLIIYKLGANEVRPENKRLLTFGKGDCILFRGD